MLIKVDKMLTYRNNFEEVSTDRQNLNPFTSIKKEAVTNLLMSRQADLEESQIQQKSVELRARRRHPLI